MFAMSMKSLLTSLQTKAPIIDSNEHRRMINDLLSTCMSMTHLYLSNLLALLFNFLSDYTYIINISEEDEEVWENRVMAGLVTMSLFIVYFFNVGQICNSS